LCTYDVTMTHIAKIIEIVGGSDRGSENAAQVAIEEARKTIHGIHGIEVMDMTATVDESTGKISNTVQV
jgi:dodecin